MVTRMTVRDKFCFSFIQIKDKLYKGDTMYTLWFVKKISRTRGRIASFILIKRVSIVIYLNFCCDKKYRARMHKRS